MKKILFSALACASLLSYGCGSDGVVGLDSSVCQSQTVLPSAMNAKTFQSWVEGTNDTFWKCSVSSSGVQLTNILNLVLTEDGSLIYTSEVIKKSLNADTWTQLSCNSIVLKDGTVFSGMNVQNQKLTLNATNKGELLTLDCQLETGILP